MKTIKDIAGLILVTTTCSFLAVPALAIPVPPVGSTYTFNLNQAATGAGLGNASGVGDYGTVTLTQALNEVDVSVALKAGYLFANTGGPHQAFAFNLGSGFASALVTVTSLNNIFQVGNGTQFSQTPWGDFTNTIDFKASVGTGLSANVTGPLQFSVKATNLTINNFVSNGTAATNKKPATVGYLFSADIGNAASGKTGNVVATGEGVPGFDPPPGRAPEPATITLIGLGLLGTFLARRRKNRTAP